MGYMFFNGPVQNGDFTFASRPGKAVGIRIAAALNRILGSEAVPHLWNTVTLAGDVRYRQHVAAGHAPVSRQDFEASAIAAKYVSGPRPPAGIATDADDAVADLAMAMITSRLSTGTLKISRERVRVCTKCGHMIGASCHPCRACGHATSSSQRARHLVTERQSGEPVLNAALIYGRKRRPPLHLLAIAGNTPPRLILSRTRDYGIDLTPLGLPGLILDPRVGVHIAVLSAARRVHADVAVMTTTQNAAANVAAYGQRFAEDDGLRLLYALHGHVPYHPVADLHRTYEAYGVDAEMRAAFETWFLPLCSLSGRNSLQADQLPALFRFFRRACMIQPTESDQYALQALRQSVREGAADWITRKSALATAIETTINQQAT